MSDKYCMLAVGVGVTCGCHILRLEHIALCLHHWFWASGALTTLFNVKSNDPSAFMFMYRECMCYLHSNDTSHVRTVKHVVEWPAGCGISVMWRHEMTTLSIKVICYCLILLACLNTFTSRPVLKLRLAAYSAVFEILTLSVASQSDLPVHLSNISRQWKDNAPHARCCYRWLHLYIMT